MTKKQQPTPSPKEAEAKPEGEQAGEELTEEQLEHVAGGALNAYLKIASVPGESTTDGHKDTIEIESFSWGATNPAITTSIKR